MGGEEQWVKEAMSDNKLVAKVLMSLAQAEFPPPPRKNNDPDDSLALQLDWSVRQRRSKQALEKKDKTRPERASPTTPLSWSGGTSVSGGGGGAADGPEESSRSPSKPVDNPLYKVAARITPPPLRSRKKKTLAELREEMSSHIKENKSLKNELEIIKLKFENLRTTKETLSRKLQFKKEGDESSKRMKLDHQSDQATETATALVAPKNAISDLPQQREEACSPASVECNDNDNYVPNESSKVPYVTIETSFPLPDLNLPIEDI